MQVMSCGYGMTSHVLRKSACLLGALMAFCSVSVGAANQAPTTKAYRLFPCEILMRISLQGLPLIDGIQVEDSVESCGTGQPLAFLPAHDSDDRSDRLPTISLSKHDDGFDIEVIRADTDPPMRYRAVKLAARTESVKLNPDIEGAPELRVSLEPVKGGSQVGIIAPETDATRIINDLARFKNLEFRHVGLLAGTRVLMSFDNIPVRSLIHLIADASNTIARAVGPSAYTFGRAANAARIEALRAELAKMSQTESGAQRSSILQKIVALSTPENPDDFPANVGYELQELYELALKDSDYVRAESFMRAWIEQIEFFANGEGSSALGLAFLDLGHVLRLKSENNAAGEALRQSMHLLDQYADTETLPAHARTYAELAALAFESDDLDESAALALQGYAVLDASELPDWDENQVYLARRVSGDVAGKIGLKYRDRGDRANAQIHLEQALKSTEARVGFESELADNWRLLVILNLQEQNDGDRAAAFQGSQIRASLSRKNPLSKEYVLAMQGFTRRLVEQEKFSAAAMLWSQLVDVLETSTSIGSNVQAPALRDLALLQRLKGDTTEAQAIERKAARLTISGAKFEADATSTSSIETALLNHTLAGSLNDYYNRLARSLGQSGKIRDLSITLAQWRRMESLVALDDLSRAITVLFSLSRTLDVSQQTPEAISNRFAVRMSELCALREMKSPRQAIPEGACSLP